jgi:hypothetical protein
MEALSHGLIPESQVGASQPLALMPPASLFASIVNTVNPSDPVEKFFAEELASRAAMARTYGAALHAMRRDGEMALFGVLSTPDANAVTTRTQAQLSVLVSEKFEVLIRQSLANERGFIRILDALGDYRARSSPCSLLATDPRFATEQSCLLYLARRYELGVCPCHRCGTVGRGCFVAARLAWQCSNCRGQTGLRRGTCMENSALPLTRWFAGIRIVLLSPKVSAKEMGNALAIGRLQTVRGLIQRIQSAIASAQPSVALAGLDQVFLGTG